MNLHPGIVDYCAQECAWQMSGELSVGGMVRAWIYLTERQKYVTMIDRIDIKTIGRMVEPVKNRNGFRQVGVRVGTSVKMHHSLVEDNITNLIDNQPSSNSHMFATEWFREYEEIHPFVDGNGRTGSLLWNFMSGTLDNPVHVPNLWNDPRRV